MTLTTIPSTTPRYSLDNPPTAQMLLDYRAVLQHLSWNPCRYTNCEVDNLDPNVIRYCAGAWIMKNLYGMHPYQVRGAATTISSLIHRSLRLAHPMMDDLAFEILYDVHITNTEYLYRIANLHDSGTPLDTICATIDQWIIELTIVPPTVDDTIHHGPDE